MNVGALWFSAGCPNRATTRNQADAMPMMWTKNRIQLMMMRHIIFNCSARRDPNRLKILAIPPARLSFRHAATCACSGVRHPMRGGVRRRCASASAQIATLLACLSSARVFVRTIERRTRRGFFSTACQRRSSLDSWVQCFPKANADAVNSS